MVRVRHEAKAAVEKPNKGEELEMKIKFKYSTSVHDWAVKAFCFCLGVRELLGPKGCVCVERAHLDILCYFMSSMKY